VVGEQIAVRRDAVHHVLHQHTADISFVRRRAVLAHDLDAADVQRSSRADDPKAAVLALVAAARRVVPEPLSGSAQQRCQGLNAVAIVDHAAPPRLTI
jgi:hypothetical protein